MIIAFLLLGTVTPENYVSARPVDYAEFSSLPAEQEKEEPQSPVYNTVWKGKTWSYPTNGTGLRNALINHLLGELGGTAHAGKFDRKELEKLSIWELEALHSNDHVGRPYVIPAKPAKKRKQAPKVQQACPT